MARVLSAGENRLRRCGICPTGRRWIDWRMSQMVILPKTCMYICVCVVATISMIDLCNGDFGSRILMIRMTRNSSGDGHPLLWRGDHTRLGNAFLLDPHVLINVHGKGSIVDSILGESNEVAVGTVLPNSHQLYIPLLCLVRFFLFQEKSHTLSSNISAACHRCLPELRFCCHHSLESTQSWMPLWMRMEGWRICMAIPHYNPGCRFLQKKYI